MNQRIQRVLDGELPRDRLDEAEAAELAVFERAIRDTVDALSAEPPQDVVAGVMAAIGEPHRRPVSAAPRGSGLAAAVAEALRWLVTPRPLALRPAWGLLGLVAALGLAVFAGRASAPGPETFAVAPDSPRVFVHFRIDAPGAQRVQLAGDFTDWQPSFSLHESTPGVWTVVVPLEPGVHQYAFVIDGERWVADPHAPSVDDGFGGSNSRLSVLLPEIRGAT